MNKTQEHLERLGDVVAQLCDFYRNLDDTAFLANTFWTARDVLVHIVFWHESFARNVSDLADGAKPRPLKGTYAQLGKRSAEEFRSCSIEELLTRFATAQGTIATSILNPLVTLIPYKVGSRSYGPDEHLSIVIDHIRDHLTKLRRAANVKSGQPRESS